MKPLREQFDPNDPNEVCGAALLARVPALAFSAARQQRVRFALRTSRPALAALRLSPAFVAAVVILGATGASAMVARYFVRTHLLAPELAATIVGAGDPAPRAAGKSRHAAPAAPAALDPSPPIESAPAAIPVPEAPKAEPLPKAAPKARSGAPAAGGPSASTPGGALMIEAMQARRAGDMARAASLLAEYRSKYPDGDLHEEALALSIEAAVARGDDNAQRLAAQYLKRYPNGRFREQADRALKAAPR